MLHHTITCMFAAFEYPFSLKSFRFTQKLSNSAANKKIKDISRIKDHNLWVLQNS